MPLGIHAGDIAVEGVFACASLFGLLVQGTQPQQKANGNQGKNPHADAQPFQGRSIIGKGASGEIERDTHGLSCPRQCAGGSRNARVSK